MGAHATRAKAKEKMKGKKTAFTRRSSSSSSSRAFKREKRKHESARTNAAEDAREDAKTNALGMKKRQIVETNECGGEANGATDASGGSSGSDEGARFEDGRVEIERRRTRTRPKCGDVDKRARERASMEKEDDERGAKRAREDGGATVSLREAIDSGHEIDDVFACRVTPSSKSAEFLVRWKGRSHANNAWVRESELNQIAPEIVQRFVSIHGRKNVSLIREAWFRPQRVVGVTGVPPNTKVYIKWWELPYRYCTWEKCDAHPEFAALLERHSQFDNEMLDRPCDFPNMPKQSANGTEGNDVVRSIARWLLATWLEHEGVCVVDNSTLPRQAEIAATFIDIRKRGFKLKAPSLIIVADENVDAWSREFSRIAPDVNLVEYRGSSECRIAVQRHEWSFAGTILEGDAEEAFRELREPRFNVLLATHSSAMLDVVLLRQVHWESIIVYDSSPQFASETSSLMLRLSTLTTAHRVLMFRSANLTDLHVTMNILDFVKRSPLSMRNLEARLLNLSPEQACMQTAALLAALTMDCQYCEVALNSKHKLQGPDVCMGSLHTARLIELAEIVLLRRAEQQKSPTPCSVFPATFDYKSATYMGFLHQLHALQSMYGPLDMTQALPKVAGVTEIR